MRILTLRDNPAQQWEDLSKAAMDRLKNENEALLTRLKELEDSGARGGGGDEGKKDLVPRASLEAANAEKAKLDDELKMKEKRLQRLQQVRLRPTTIPRLHPCRIALPPSGIQI